MAEAVAAELQRGAGKTKSIIDDIKSTLLVEGRAWVAIGHNDLHCAGAMEDGPNAAPILIPTAAQTL